MIIRRPESLSNDDLPPNTATAGRFGHVRLAVVQIDRSNTTFTMDTHISIADADPQVASLFVFVHEDEANRIELWEAEN